MEDFYNTTVWSGEYYGDTMKNWRVGWGGSVKTRFAMLKSGTEQSKERARLTLDYLCSHQAPSGFYYGKISKGIIEDDSVGVPGMEKRPAGYINERVNMSDWEGPNCVGGVFYGTCWPGESLLLTFAELMVYDEMK